MQTKLTLNSFAFSVKHFSTKMKFPGILEFGFQFMFRPQINLYMLIYVGLVFARYSFKRNVCTHIFAKHSLNVSLHISMLCFYPFQLVLPDFKPFLLKHYFHMCGYDEELSIFFLAWGCLKTFHHVKTYMLSQLLISL